MNKTIKKDIIKLIIISILFTCAFTIFQCVNDDFLTHIARTYNLSISFHNGNYNPYIYQSCYEKYGYPFGIFYPDTFLKPFAMLMSWGMNIYPCMALMLFFINLFTLFIPYFLLQKTEYKEKAFILSLLYFLYPYRFMDYAIRFSIGELFFFIFFPFILYGLYKMFEKNEFSFGLLFGFWGIAHGHILSILLLILFLVFFYVYKIKSLNIKIIKCTLINAVLVLLSCMDVYLPIIEAQMSEDLLYEIDPAFGGSLIQNSIQVINLPFNRTHVINTITFCVVATLIYIAIKQKNIYARSILCFFILFIIQTNLFPWKWFFVLDIVQFPFRFFVYGCIPWLILSFKMHEILIKHSSLKISLMHILLVTEILLTFAFAYVYKTFDYYEMYANIGAGDYINAEVDSKDLTFLELNKERNLNIMTNEYVSENGYLPVFYNTQYEVLKDGEPVSYENKDGLLYSEELKDSYYLVTINYKTTFLQNMSYIISIMTSVSFFIYFIFKKVKNN